MQNHRAKNLKLVINQSLISIKSQNLFSAICSKIYAVSNTNLILLLNIRGSYKFSFSLETVISNWKKILQLIISAYMWSFMSFELLGKYKQPLITYKDKITKKSQRKNSFRHFHLKIIAKLFRGRSLLGNSTLITSQLTFYIQITSLQTYS